MSEESMIEIVREAIAGVRINMERPDFVAMDRRAYYELAQEVSRNTRIPSLPNEIFGIKIVVVGNGFAGVQVVSTAENEYMHGKGY